MPGTQNRTKVEPNWHRLFEIANSQDGYVTTRQAAEAGYSSPLLFKHVRAGRLTRALHGVYRLVDYPVQEREELALVWLWSAQAGVFSHQTALALHGLSDVLPSRTHVTLPQTWRARRVKAPESTLLYYGDIPANDRTWFGAVPVTTVARTLNDCARGELSPELLLQAVSQALRRKLVARTEIGPAIGCVRGLEARA